MLSPAGPCPLSLEPAGLCLGHYFLTGSRWTSLPRKQDGERQSQGVGAQPPRTRSVEDVRGEGRLLLGQQVSMESVWNTATKQVKELSQVPATGAGGERPGM